MAGQDARPSGHITVSLAPAMSLNSLVDDLAAFMRSHREIELKIVTTNALSNLARRKVGVSLRYAHSVSDDVVGRRVLQCVKSVYCTASYAADMKNDGGQGLEWIDWNEDFGAEVPLWVQSSPFPKAHLHHRVAEPLAQAMLASRGLGLSYLPCFLADTYPGLVRAPFQVPILDRSIWLLLHEDLRGAARIRIFVEFLVERIRGRKGEFLAGVTAAS